MEFFEPPPEVREQIQHAVQMHAAHAEDYRHAVQRLLENLDEEDLITFRHLMLNVSQDETGRIAAHYEGQASILAQVRFNICPGCGVNHDKEAEEMLKHHTSDTDTDTASMDAPNPFEATTVVMGVIPEELSDEDLLNMERYHLDDLRDETTHQLMGFACTGIQGMRAPCGMVYPSIEDRMLRGPETCSGCFQRMGHG